MSEHDENAIEAARLILIAELLTTKPGDEPYDYQTTIGEVEVYRLRRAMRAAIDEYVRIGSAD